MIFAACITGAFVRFSVLHLYGLSAESCEMCGKVLTNPMSVV